MTTRVKWVSGVIWVSLSLFAMTLVLIFIRQSEVPPARGFLALPSVDSVIRATDELGQVKGDLGQFHQAVNQLMDLEKAADRKGTAETKQQVAAIAKLIDQAVIQEESRWKAISAITARVTTESKELREEADAVRKTLSSLQTEGTQWKASLISNLLWFLLLSASLMTLFVSPNLVGMMQFLLRFMRGVKVPGFELSFAEGGAQRNHDIYLWFSDAFEELRGQAKKALRLFVEQQDIDRVFHSAAGKIREDIERMFQNAEPVLGGTTLPMETEKRQAAQRAVGQIRCTLFVRDVVFKDYLCQLLDYYPRGPAGGRAGRAWPVCYGMIGRVWRSEKSEMRSLGSPLNETTRTLIDEYAMTEEQVKELVGNGRSSLCLLVRDREKHPQGVLYMDAPVDGVFGLPEGANLESAVREDSNGNFTSLLGHCEELGEKLSIYSEKIYGNAPLIEVMETHES